MQNANRTARDILGNWRLYSLLYGLPIAVLILSGSAPPLLRTVVWSLACLVMGGACLANAARCGRIHCYFTGPFFVVMALIVLGVGAGLFSFGNNTWNDLGLAILIGGVGLTYGPEVVLGKYRTTQPGRPPQP